MAAGSRLAILAVLVWSISVARPTAGSECSPIGLVVRGYPAKLQCSADVLPIPRVGDSNDKSSETGKCSPQLMVSRPRRIDEEI